MKKIANVYFSIIIALLAVGFVFWGAGAVVTPQDVPVVNSVAELRNHLTERVKISTEYARYTYVNIRYNHDRLRGMEPRSLWEHVSRTRSGRDALYFLEFDDGVVILRGAYNTNSNFTETHDYIQARVFNFGRDEIAQLLLLRYAEEFGRTRGGELRVGENIITNRAQVREGTRVIVQVHPYSTMISFEPDREGLMSNGLRIMIISGILLIPYGIWWVIYKIKTKRRERLADLDRVF